MADNKAMAGKTVLITGGTGGIGKATAAGLAALGARVGIVGRDRRRAEAAAADIRRETDSPAVDCVRRRHVLAGRGAPPGGRGARPVPPLDVLVNNVGGFWATRHTTADGLEHTFALNHLAPFLLTNLLLDRLQSSAPARVVTVSSGAQAMGRIDFDDLQGERGYSGPARVQPVEAGQRHVHLRAGPPPGRHRRHRHRAAPRRRSHRLRRRRPRARARPADSARAAVHEDAGAGRGHVGLPGVLAGGRGRHRRSTSPTASPSVPPNGRTTPTPPPGCGRSAPSSSAWSTRNQDQQQGRSSPTEGRQMNVGIHIVSFTLAGGPAAIGPTLAEVARAAEEAGVTNLSVMDHYLQMGGRIGSADEPMLEGYTTLGLPGRQHQHGRAPTAGHRRHLPAPWPARQDRFDAGRAVRRPGHARRSAPPGTSGNTTRSACRSRHWPSGSNASRRPCRSSSRCGATTYGPYAGKHYQLAETINSPQPLSRPHPPIMIGGGGEKKTLRLVAKYADACNLFAGPDAGPDAVKAKLDVLRGHCAREGTDYDRIRKTILYVGPLEPDDEGGKDFADQMAATPT